MGTQGQGTTLVTGASGFLGKAVLATLLEVAPPPRTLVLLRAADAAAAATRLREEVLTAEPFAALAPLLAELLAADRLRAVAADLAVAPDGPDGPDAAAGLGGDRGSPDPAWGEVETVVHCAASVSFEEPLDTILELNAFGPAHLLESLREAGARPHFVQVSTAYAADCLRGRVPEAGPIHPALAGLDPEAALAESRAWRRAAGPGDGAAAALARRGRDYAVAAGWPDTYALSKALGERLLSERWERTTIVRPTIIESALRRPRPGWLEGIKVADPLILAYAARGLTHLAGEAGNLIDLVPVDLVANACVAAALAGPAAAGPRALAVGSSSRNPLRIGELAGHIRDRFGAEPLRRRDGTPIPIGELRFVPRARALRRAAARQRLAATAAALAPPPRRRSLRRQARLAAQVTRMVGIYAPYTELDCAFDDTEAQALAAALPADLGAALPFDPSAYDWHEYLGGAHLPAVAALAQRRR